MTGQADEEPRAHDECYACPVGSFFLTYQGAQPEAAEHLLNAASEVLLALKAFVEAAEQTLQNQRRARGAQKPARMRKIDID